MKSKIASHMKDSPLRKVLHKEESTMRSILGANAPQAPYLFNISLAELDDYVMTTLQEEVNNLNKRNDQNRTDSRAYTSIRATKRKNLRYLAKTRLHLKKLPMDPKVNDQLTNRCKKQTT